MNMTYSQPRTKFFMLVTLLIFVATLVTSLGATAAPDSHHINRRPNRHDSYPTITTRFRSNVRKGPHLDTAINTVLPANYTARITRRNIKGDWWEIESIGRHPRRLGYIAGWIVRVSGDTRGVPVLARPTLTTHNQHAHVYLEPSTSSIIRGVVLPNHTLEPIGRTANNRWWQIPWDHNSAWVQATSGTIGGDYWSLPVVNIPKPTPTPLPTPSYPDVPIHKDPGHPPSNACVAHNASPFAGDYVNVHINPGRHWGLVARLENWAEVINAERGWYMILLGPGSVGWVWHKDVYLIGPCSAYE